MTMPVSSLQQMGLMADFHSPMFRQTVCSVIDCKGSYLYLIATDLAAAAAWSVIQAFYSNLDQLDNTTDSKQFNLATESYGGMLCCRILETRFLTLLRWLIGHYGPAFYNYFYEHNQAIVNGTTKGVKLSMNSLTVGFSLSHPLVKVT